jgi:hypothetical protein
MSGCGDDLALGQKLLLRLTTDHLPSPFSGVG